MERSQKGRKKRGDGGGLKQRVTRRGARFTDDQKRTGERGMGRIGSDLLGTRQMSMGRLGTGKLILPTNLVFVWTWSGLVKGGEGHRMVDGGEWDDVDAPTNLGGNGEIVNKQRNQKSHGNTRFLKYCGRYSTPGMIRVGLRFFPMQWGSASPVSS